MKNMNKNILIIAHAGSVGINMLEAIKDARPELLIVEASEAKKMFKPEPEPIPYSRQAEIQLIDQQTPISGQERRRIIRKNKRRSSK